MSRAKWVAVFVAVVLAVGLVAGSTVVGSPGGEAGGLVAAGSGPQPTLPDAPPAGVDPFAPGVPGGFPRTRAGAVAAATDYGLRLDGPGVLDPARRAVNLDRVAASSARDELERGLSEIAERVTDGFGLTPQVMASDEFVWRVAPAGWQMRVYDDDRAVVAIWGTGVLMSRGVLLAPSQWATTVIEIVWERGDWRLVEFGSEPGPTPPSLGTGPDEAAARAINRFEPYVHLPSWPTWSR